MIKQLICDFIIALSFYIVNFWNPLWIKTWCRPPKSHRCPFKQTIKCMEDFYLWNSHHFVLWLSPTHQETTFVDPPGWEYAKKIERVTKSPTAHYTALVSIQTNKQMYGRFLLVKFSPLCPMTVSNSLGNHICRSTWLGICQEDQKGHQVTHCTALTTLVCAAASGS